MSKQNDPNWVVTGKDRDEAYGTILVAIIMVVVGAIVVPHIWWLGLIIIALGLLAIRGSRRRLRNEV